MMKEALPGATGRPARAFTSVAISHGQVIELGGSRCQQKQITAVAGKFSWWHLNGLTAPTVTTLIQSKDATAHTENCANRFCPTPVAPFSRYRAQAQSGSNRLVLDDQ